jgi:ELWxxDGT repeat protein
VWRTDGTAAGTIRVTNVDPGPDASITSSVVTVGGKIYFAAFDSGHGDELWRNSGGIGSGLLLKDIWPGATGWSPTDLRVVGSTLLFTAIDPTHGKELWRTDGTQSGTKLVKDLNPGNAWSSAFVELPLAGSALLSAEAGSKGTELYTYTPSVGV